MKSKGSTFWTTLKIYCGFLSRRKYGFLHSSWEVVKARKTGTTHTMLDYVVFRLFYVLTLCGIMVYKLDSSQPDKFFLYFETWAIFTHTVYSFLFLRQVLAHNHHRRELGRRQRMPEQILITDEIEKDGQKYYISRKISVLPRSQLSAYEKLIWVLFNISAALSVVCIFGQEGVLNILIRKSTKQHREVRFRLKRKILVLMSFVLTLIDLLTNTLPMRFGHIIYPVCFTGFYIIIIYIYHIAQSLTDDQYLYEENLWTWPYIGIILILVIISHFLITLVAKFRDFIISLLDRSRTLSNQRRLRTQKRLARRKIMHSIIGPDGEIDRIVLEHLSPSQEDFIWWKDKLDDVKDWAGDSTDSEQNIILAEDSIEIELPSNLPPPRYAKINERKSSIHPATFDLKPKIVHKFSRLEDITLPSPPTTYDFRHSSVQNNVHVEMKNVGVEMNNDTNINMDELPMVHSTKEHKEKHRTSNPHPRPKNDKGKIRRSKRIRSPPTPDKSPPAAEEQNIKKRHSGDKSRGSRPKRFSIEKEKHHHPHHIEDRTDDKRASIEKEKLLLFTIEEDNKGKTDKQKSTPYLQNNEEGLQSAGKETPPQRLSLEKTKHPHKVKRHSLNKDKRPQQPNKPTHVVKRLKVQPRSKDALQEHYERRKLSSIKEQEEIAFMNAFRRAYMLKLRQHSLKDGRPTVEKAIDITNIDDIELQHERNIYSKQRQDISLNRLAAPKSLPISPELQPMPEYDAPTPSRQRGNSQPSIPRKSRGATGTGILKRVRKFSDNNNKSTDKSARRAINEQRILQRKIKAGLPNPVYDPLTTPNIDNASTTFQYLESKLDKTKRALDADTIQAYTKHPGVSIYHEPDNEAQPTKTEAGAKTVESVTGFHPLIQVFDIKGNKRKEKKESHKI